MQKNILIFIFSLLILGTIKGQELNTENNHQELVNQFSLALTHGIKYDDRDTLNYIYPSIQDVKFFLNQYQLTNEVPEEAWNELELERAEDLKLYFEDITKLKQEGTENGFDWTIATLEDVSFQVETTTNELDIEKDEDLKEIELDLFYITIFISDKKQILSIEIDEAVVFNKELKLIEVSDWNFRLNEH